MASINALKSSTGAAVASAAQRVALVANAASGQHGADDAMDQLARALESHGIEVQRHRPLPEGSLDDAAAQAAKSGAAVVVALGGDGTVNTVAQALRARPIETRPALAILPQGTFNLVARRYGLPATVDALAALIAQGHTQTIGAGEVNGRSFFNNCSFGLYTSMIEARERHKARFGRHRVVALGSALVTLLTSRGRLAVRLDVRASASPAASAPIVKRLRTSLVFIGANPLQLGELGEPLAREVEAGALAFVAVKSTGVKQLARFAWGALQASAAQLQEIETLSFTQAQIATRARLLRCVLDGEIVRLRSPLTLRYEPEALRLCMPPRVEA